MLTHEKHRAYLGVTLRLLCVPAFSDPVKELLGAELVMKIKFGPVLK
jgi:hypothetical protein